MVGAPPVDDALAVDDALVVDDALAVAAPPPVDDATWLEDAPPVEDPGFIEIDVPQPRARVIVVHHTNEEWIVFMAPPE